MVQSQTLQHCFVKMWVTQLGILSIKTCPLARDVGLVMRNALCWCSRLAAMWVVICELSQKCLTLCSSNPSTGSFWALFFKSLLTDKILHQLLSWASHQVELRTLIPSKGCTASYIPSWPAIAETSFWCQLFAPLSKRDVICLLLCSPTNSREEVSVPQHLTAK